MAGPSLYCLLKLKFLVFCDGFVYLFCEPFLLLFISVVLCTFFFFFKHFFYLLRFTYVSVCLNSLGHCATLIIVFFGGVLFFPLNSLRCKAIWFEAPCVNLQSKSVQSTEWSQLPLLDIGRKQSAEVLVLILTWY